MSFKSPGVYPEELKLNYARRTPNAIRAAFVGNFEKGPVGEALPITSKEEFIKHFGYPTDVTYNDWYQVERFLKYYEGIFVTRASNLEHQFDACATLNFDITVTRDADIKSFDIADSNPYKISAEGIKNLHEMFKLYDRFTIDGDNADAGAIYTVTDVESFTFTPALAYDVFAGNQILRLAGATNASVDMPTAKQYASIATNKPNGEPANEPYVESRDAFDLYKDQYKTNNVITPLSIWARSPGSWGNTVQVAIVTPEDFRVNYSASDPQKVKQAFPGVVVDHVFRQPPQQGQFGVIVSVDNKVQEQFVVTADRQNSGIFIEDEINQRSNYIFVKRGIGELYSTAFTSVDLKRPLTLLGGKDSQVGPDDIEKATKVFLDKDVYQFDVMIANELDEGLSAINLADQRGDITTIFGASLNNFGFKSTDKIVDSLVDFRTHLYLVDGCACTSPKGEAVLNASVLRTSNTVFVGNYCSIFDVYSNKQRLINIAGDIAGLRCETNSKYGEHKASAGVNRGVLKTGIRLLFNPTQAQRDILYTHNINPVVAMSAVGNVLWGQRTMASLDDDFLPWHVRSMTNLILRSASTTLKSFVMENVNSYTMNAVVGSLQPLFTRLKADGGLIDYYIKCDFNNNRHEELANSELNVDLYYRPSGVAEFIRLRLVNTGSETIAKVLEREQQRRNL